MGRSDNHKRQRNVVVRGIDLVIRDGTLDGALTDSSPRNGLPVRLYRWGGHADDPAAIVARLHDGEPSFTCPACGAVSYHPGDIREGYCGRCHDWTGEPA